MDSGCDHCVLVHLTLFPSMGGGGDEWFQEEKKSMPDSMSAENAGSARNNKGNIPLAQVAIEIISTAEHAAHVNYFGDIPSYIASQA